MRAMPDGTSTDNLSPSARFLLWDYSRGSLPYDLLCALLVLIMALLPPSLLGDPMAGWP